MISCLPWLHLVLFLGIPPFLSFGSPLSPHCLCELDWSSLTLCHHGVAFCGRRPVGINDAVSLNSWAECSRDAWLQRNSGTQFLPVQLLAHCSYRRLRPKPSILHWVANWPAALIGPCSPFAMQPSTLPSQLDSVGINCIFNLAFFSGRRNLKKSNKQTRSE